MTSEGAPSEPAVFNIAQIESLPVTSKQLQAATRTDGVLSKILHFTKEGWPKKFDAPLRPYWIRRQELTVEQNCVLCAVVPKKLQPRLLEELHRDHPGISRMKAVAHVVAWTGSRRPGVGYACQAVKHAPVASPMHPWEWPPRPWQCVHLDFAGPFQGCTFLVAVDAHSKWPEVEVMTSTTASKIIEVLRRRFAAYGLPEQIVSDNGPQLVSEEFAAFMRVNRIKHIRSAPYHLASNGLAERFMQSLKTGLKTSVTSGLSLSQRLSNYLLTYRSYHGGFPLFVVSASSDQDTA